MLLVVTRPKRFTVTVGWRHFPVSGDRTNSYGIYWRCGFVDAVSMHYTFQNST